MRHCAVRIVDTALQVFHTNAGDCPERVLLTEIDPRPDWMDWEETDAATVLEPEMDYEGVNQPPAPSRRGAIHEPVRQLRDP